MPLGFGINFRPHLNCWNGSRTSTYTHVLSASEMVSMTDYFRQDRELRHCFLQIHGTREEDCQATCGETHWERAHWKAPARHRPTMRRTSRWHVHVYLLMVRSTLVSSPFDASTAWSKSSLYARHHRVHPTKRNFGVPLKNVQRWLKRFCDNYYEQSNSTQQLHMCPFPV